MSSFRDKIQEARMNTDLLKAQKSNNLMYMSVMTLSNMHATVAELYRNSGNGQKASYHMNLANQLKGEANKHANKEN